MSLIVHLLTTTSPVVLGLIFGLIGIIIYWFVNKGPSNDDDDSDDDDDNNNNNTAKKRVIKRLEVSEHNTIDDLWVVIDNKVYDLTKFVPHHPGGELAVAKHAGGDATKGFYGIQHPERAFFEIEDYFIGTVPENERMKYLSTAEIAKHNTENDLWLVVDDRVFDITKFSHSHPGGLHVLLQHSHGRDATRSFYGSQHKKFVHPMINEYFIGYVMNEGDVDFVHTNRKKKANDAKVKLTREQYTMEEVKKHNRDDDAWIIIDGSVYDITEYQHEHPGGAVIMNCAGGDATSDFKNAGHPSYVKDLMAGFFIGYVAKN